MDPPDVLTRPLPSASASNTRLHPPQQSSPYSRAHSLPSVSPALNHAHSMESATPPAPPASAVAAASEAAAAAVSSSSLPPPGLDAWMQTQFQQAFQKQITKIDFDDFKGNKHQLPLARIKKIMKSDEDVRMISAEAPILFAKACELFILDLTLRAWAYTEHAPSKRRTLQRNDIAAAIQNAEIFDFLHEIVPVQPQDPSEEGTPPHRSPEESTRSRRIHTTPDVLLERPLLDPYGDALPVPVHQHLAHRASRQHSAAAAANAAAQAAQEASAHAAMQSQYAAYTSRGAVNLYSGLTPEGLLANAASPGYTSSDPSAYGMTSMSRGTSLDLLGAGSGGVVGAGVVMSTPNFQGGSMAIDQLPDVPPDTPNTGNATGSTLTPLPPARRPMQTGLSGSIHSPAISNLTPPTMLSPQHSGMPQQHPHAAAQMQMQYHAQQQMLHHSQQQQTPQLHTQPPTPGATFFPGAGLPLHTPSNQAYLQMQQQQQQQQLHNQWLESNGGGHGAVPQSPAAVPSVSTPSSSTNTLSTPNMFSSSYSAEGSIDDEQQ